MTIPINVFARFPQRGAVKSRLACHVGSGRALAIYRQLVLRTLATVRSFDRDALRLWTAGPHWHPLFESVPATHRRCQPRGDLGHRMRVALDASIREASGGIVVGTDCPGLRATHLAEAARVLPGHDLVLGPALDGGYYLVGLCRPAPALFRNMPWGTGDVLRITLVRARQLGLRVAMLPALRDLDDGADLRALDPF